MRRIFLFLAFCCVTLLGAAPANAAWQRAISAHFTLYVDGTAQQAREVAERLERFDGLLRRLSPVPPRDSPIRLTIYMPSSDAGVASLAGSDFVAGYYSPNVAGSFMVAPRRNWGSAALSADTILFHEYTHHFMLANFSTAYPAWFVEGYAELFSTVLFNETGAIMIGAFADHRSRELSLTPPRLSALLGPWPRVTTLADRLNLYANAWYLTHYLTVSGARPGQLGRYLALTGEGRTVEQAAQEAFGGLPALQRDFLRYRSTRFVPTITIQLAQVPPVGPVAVTAVSEGEASILLLQARYQGGVRREDIAGFARRVRARVAEVPGDPAALQLLADTEFLAGDYPAATRAVDALLALRPESPRALLRRGLIEAKLLEDGHVTEMARWSVARDWIRRGNRLEPDDPLILFEYYRAFSRQRVGRPPANAATALARAYELVPQDFEVRAAYAERLIDERRFREAVAVLGPVAYSPHPTTRTEAALRRLESIRGLADGAEPPPPPPEPPTTPARN